MALGGGLGNAADDAGRGMGGAIGGRIQGFVDGMHEWGEEIPMPDGAYRLGGGLEAAGAVDRAAEEAHVAGGPQPRDDRGRWTRDDRGGGRGKGGGGQGGGGSRSGGDGGHQRHAGADAADRPRRKANHPKVAWPWRPKKKVKTVTRTVRIGPFSRSVTRKVERDPRG